MSLSTQNTAKHVRLAPATMAVLARCDQWCVLVSFLAHQAPSCEKAIPRIDIIKKGAISLRKWLRPRLPQVQRRLSWYAGTIPTTLPANVAHTASGMMRNP